MSQCFVLPHPDPLEGVFPPTVSNFPHFQRPLGCGDPESSFMAQAGTQRSTSLTVFSSLTGVFLAVPQGFKVIYHSSHTWFLQKYQKLYHNKPNTLHGSHFSYLISLKICWLSLSRSPTWLFLATFTSLPCLDPPLPRPWVFAGSARPLCLHLFRPRASPHHSPWSSSPQALSAPNSLLWPLRLDRVLLVLPFPSPLHTSSYHWGTAPLLVSLAVSFSHGLPGGQHKYNFICLPLTGRKN